MIRELVGKIPGVRPLARTLRFIVRNNVRKTLIVNFRFLPFKQAVKLPLWVHGKLKVRGVGRIVIDAPLRSGMILMGYDNRDEFSASSGRALFIVDGELVFKGEMEMSADFTIHVFKGARLIIGRFSFFGYGFRIRCSNSVTLGKWLRLAVESQIFDTNFHYTRNLETGTVVRRSAPIVIGDRCWIGNRSTVMKGCVLPDGCIVASNSLVNRDYAKAGVKPNSLLAGTPAKVISEGHARVFSVREEQKISDFFDENPSIDTYTGAPESEESETASGAEFSLLMRNVL